MRPLLDRELLNGQSFDPTVLVEPSKKALTISENLKARAAAGGTGFDSFGLVRFVLTDEVFCRSHICSKSSSESQQAFPTYQYTFDHVYDVDSNQVQVYDHSARSAVLSTLQVRLVSG